MASKTQKTEKIRARKHRPNKVNEKSVRKDLRVNLNVIGKLENENRE